MKFNLPLVLSLFLICFASVLFAQRMTFVRGKVLDAETKEPLPFVSVVFLGTPIGTETDLDGSFVVESKFASDSVQISYVGYETQTIHIELNTRQELNIALAPLSLNLDMGIVVKAEKSGYKRKNNPAVDLMKNVIAHKDDNRMEALDYYNYEKYEKIEFDINNFDPDKLKKRRTMKKFQFMFEYVDTSDLNGKPYLPFFIQEASSKVYYRKEPQSKKEYREGVKVTGIEEYVDLKDFTTMMDVLYQDVNIYQDNVRILDLSFMSPLNSTLANTFYRFYITDTLVMVNEYACIKVSFLPVNNQNIAFNGDLFIRRDSSYAVVKAELGITRQINLNFIQDLKLEQEFTLREGVWVLSKDQVVIDFAPFKKGTGVFGQREVSYRGHVFNQKQDESLYEGTQAIVAEKDAYVKDENFWQEARHDSLTTEEKGIYQMIDTLQKVPTFRTVVNVLSILGTGYKAFGPIDVGPVGAFYSFNPVEGFRLKLGGETNLKFHPKINLGGYAAYGFKDEEWKYAGSILYSFKENYKANPKHFFRVGYQHDVNLVGQSLEFSSPDNFLLSFQRGDRDKMLFIDKYKADYFLELNSNLSWNLNYTNTDQRPIGGLILKYQDPLTGEDAYLPKLRTSEVGIQMRFAPNEQYIQGRSYRMSIYNKYPVFTLNFATGLKDWLGGDYEYQRASLNVFKRFYLSLLGTLRFEAEAGRIWGNGLPYFLLHLPRANQSFAYRSGAFNMMNYQEFVSDQYVSVNIEHFFNGFFFNKIPLLRKLKLREVITFKGIYGRLSDENNPNKNPEFIQFIEEDGRSITYTLEGKPYMEASFGVGNIAKFLRLDVVRRLTYLDHPDVPSLFGVRGLGLRMKIKFEF